MKANGERGGTHSEAEQAQWVQRYRSSGLGLKRFAAQHGLPAGQLHYWTYSPRGSKSVARATGFHEVTAAIPWKSAASWAAEIGLPDGTTVRLDGRAEVAWVKQLVESLRLSCSR